MRSVIIALFVLLVSVYETHSQGKIAFGSNDGDAEIYVMNPDGTNILNLTNNTAQDSEPSFSWDGRKIAFVSNRDGNLEIYIMNADGTSQTRVTNNSVPDGAPSLSGDGSKIAFVSGSEIYLINADGTNLTRLTNDSFSDSAPSLTSDGSKVAFASNRDGGNFEIYTINADGTNQNRVTNNSVHDEDPSFSRDSSTIVFVSVLAGSGREIHSMNVDGTNVIRLTTNDVNESSPAFSPDGSMIAFRRTVSPQADIFVMPVSGGIGTNLTNGTSAEENSPSWGGVPLRRPVLIVPGIAGTYAASTSNDMLWLLNRGLSPTTMQIDPLARVYHDLIKTLENIGYVKDKDLFVVNYDWRLVPGPKDGNFDGSVTGISATSISDEHFEYGVDYLGLAMKKAFERWEQDNGGEPLDEVNIIAHSTGGLVARTYIQSPAYNAVFTGSKKLPKVKNLVMVGVPNRGASKAWNALQDNWNADDAYKYVLSKIVNRAYQKVLAGHTISGPDHNIDADSIRDDSGNPNHIKFIDQYVPTIRALLATYDFINFGSGFTNVNNDPAARNDWVLDLNAGLDFSPAGDPSSFADECKPTVIFADGHPTPTFVSQILSGGQDVVFNFDDYLPSDVQTGIPWFMEIPGSQGGDATVPTVSSTGQFVGDGRVTLRKIALDNPDHTGLMSNLSAQTVMLDTIGADYDVADISTTLAVPAGVPGAIVDVIFDPVEGFLIDAKGRRLGYTTATGPLQEIPGSVWFGGSDGAGWIFGDVERPLRLELLGLGENYYAMVAIHDTDADGGVVGSGFLAHGETKLLPVAVGTASVSGRVTGLNGRGIKGVFMAITDENGYLRTTLTNSFGYYRFYEVPAESSYQISASSRRYRFKPSARSFDLMDNLLDFDFVSAN